MELHSLGALDDDALAAAYAPVQTPWLRLNFVSTLDGAVQGDNDLSTTISNDPDSRVFGALRDLADVVIAGAGTVRDEDYEPNPKPIVLVTRSGRLPGRLVTERKGRVMAATVASSPGLAEMREKLGDDNVFVLGDDEVDLAALRERLVAEGYADLLCEGGPHLAHDLLRAGVVDELCLTTVPRVIAGDHLRLAAGAPFDVDLTLHGLLESEGTLLGRWLVR